MSTLSPLVKLTWQCNYIRCDSVTRCDLVFTLPHHATSWRHDPQHSDFRKRRISFTLYAAIRVPTSLLHQLRRQLQSNLLWTFYTVCRHAIICYRRLRLLLAVPLPGAFRQSTRKKTKRLKRQMLHCLVYVALLTCVSSIRDQSTLRWTFRQSTSFLLNILRLTLIGQSLS